MIRKFTLVFALFHATCTLWLIAPGYGCNTAAAQTSVPYWTRIKQFLSISGANSPELRKSVSSIDRYNRIYDWVHRQDKHKYDSLSKHGVTNWDRYQNVITYRYSPEQDSLLAGSLRPKATVFGWHPYWMGSAFKEYKFNLLSCVSWFSYHINTQTGDPENPETLDKTSISELVTLAHAKSCRVLLTATCHGSEETKLFLSNTDAQAQFIRNICSFINELNMDGADISFEDVPDGQSGNMTVFLQNLSVELKKSRHFLTVGLPVYDINHVYELPQLSKSVDLFIITGYDYFSGQSRTFGPVAPLNAPEDGYSIKKSVDAYLQTGVARSKLLLGLPYYGALWTGKSGGGVQPDTILEFSDHLSFRVIMGRYGSKNASFDPVSCSKFHLVKPVPDSDYIEKCWFDDSFTLGEKLSWALNEELAGVGLWALGYDNGYPDMWQMIATRYGNDTTIVIQTPGQIKGALNISGSISELSPLIVVSGIFMAGFFLLGLVIALFDWRVREVFFRNKTLRLLYIIVGGSVLLLTGSAVIVSRGFESDTTSQISLLGAGILVGALATTILFLNFEKNRSNLP